ncbi:nuclear transport factor 2 family protein [Paraburkholderia guartelaensis]|uniref:Nuclear transport factor 2 family protein n=1 Tax=Paraburkholderia guartelaensis TaxID=2546446 RepID=A0A4R5L2P2_9BURK|nr:nuclear transport factor 2 family protein [Paraburkholderia guartelaensis]TDG02871.1 nuclear transport factor 2 family protein [Paraburkholderia guartelaensis]
MGTTVFLTGWQPCVTYLASESLFFAVNPTGTLMPNIVSRCVIAASVAGALALFAANSFADTINDQLRPRLDKIETTWKAQNAEGVAAVYSDNAIVTGQDTPVAALGHTAIVAKVKELMGDAKSTKISIFKAEKLNENAALTWVTWEVEPKASAEEPFATKSLFVWKKIDGVWLIVADMYAMGPMAKH